MTIVNFETPAFSRRAPDMICWRVAAIYRCCIRIGMDKAWALEKLREISPDGKRDHMADLWFTDIERVRRFKSQQNQVSHAYLDNSMAMDIAEAA